MDNQKVIDYSNKGKFYDCENKTDMNLTRQGWLNFGDEKTRVYGIMRKNQRGEDILSFTQSVNYKTHTVNITNLKTDAKSGNTLKTQQIVTGKPNCDP